MGEELATEVMEDDWGKHQEENQTAVTGSTEALDSTIISQLEGRNEDILGGSVNHSITTGDLDRQGKIDENRERGQVDLQQISPELHSRLPLQFSSPVMSETENPPSQNSILINGKEHMPSEFANLQLVEVKNCEIRSVAVDISQNL